MKQIAACAYSSLILHPSAFILSDGLLVQWDDTWFAPRKSGFNSPAVHYCRG